MAGRLRRTLRGLVLFHLLLLTRVLLLQLLRLLRVFLLELLLLSVVVVFRRSLLVFGLLLLLQFLVILRLLGRELILLLLILLIGRGIPGLGRRERVRLQFARVVRGSGCRFRRRPFRKRLGCWFSGFRGGSRLVTARFVRGRSFVFAARFGGSYHSGFEIGGTGSRRDRRLALILGRAQF